MLKVKKLICSTIAAAAVFSAVTAPSALISSNSSTRLVNSINAEASSALGTIEALQNVNIRTGPSTSYQKVGLLCGGKRVSYYDICGDWVSISPTGCRWVCLSYVRRV